MIFIRLSVCVLLAAGALTAQDDWRDRLHRIQQTVQLAIGRTDNYICTQDLSRVYYASAKEACRPFITLPARRPNMEDRLKLDVAVSDGKEIYSWHGEGKFSASTVADIVRSGPISSGTFTGYLRNIFAEKGVLFTYKGQSRADGLNVDQFDYKVPLPSSRYGMQAGKGYVLAPFHGSFSALAETSQLYSLSVTADEDQIPRKSDICTAQTTLTYQLVKIGKHQSLLPASFDLVMATRDGNLTDSKGKYSQCREYAGESIVHFDNVSVDDAAAKLPELHSQLIKSGVFLPIALATIVDEDSAYAGQPIEANLTHNVKVNKLVTLHKGAILKGTLTQFQIFDYPGHGAALRFEFTSITDGANLYLCDAIPFAESDFAPVYATGSRGRLQAPTSNSREPPDGDIRFQVRHLHLDHNYVATLETTHPPPDESP